MHAYELVELASLVATHASVLIEGPEPIPADCVEEYWVASKSRLDAWARALKRLGPPAAEASDDRTCRPGGLSLRGLLEEILSGEVLTRVWLAAMTAYDEHRGSREMEPLARSVLIGHLETRHRVLALMVCSPRIDAPLAVRMNRLRRRCERWTDMLIGSMARWQGALAGAADRSRAEEFGEDLRYQQAQPGGHQVWPLVLASLKGAFRQFLGPISPNTELNARIGASILSCFRPGMFDSTGLPLSAWMVRLAKAADDTQGMIDDLLRLEGAAGGDPHRVPLRPRRFRG